MDVLRFPFAVLDFEASALDEDSYPIECGLAVRDGAATRVWASLIAPQPTWLRSGRWSKSSEKVHGIPLSALDGAPAAAEVAAQLNERCAAFDTVWCDGGDYDLYWLKRLFDATRLVPAFRLRDVGELFERCPELESRVRKLLSQRNQAHRAGDDAVRICDALAQALLPEPSPRPALSSTAIPPTTA